jgi:hypothetical protein
MACLVVFFVNNRHQKRTARESSQISAERLVSVRNGDGRRNSRQQAKVHDPMRAAGL